MRINDIKSFKSDSVTSSTTAEQEAALQEEAIEDYFVGPEESGTSCAANGNADPIDDYTAGLISGGTVASSETADVESWLADFPPSLAKVVAGNENALNYLDLVAKRYEQAKADLLTLKSTYEAEIASGQASAGRIGELNRCLALIESALSRCEVEMGKVEQQATRQDAIYLKEQQSMKDLNGDDWVGRPYANGSYFVKTDDDTGEVTYYDYKTKTAIACPMMDPDGESTITSNENLKLIDADKAMTSEDKSSYDLYLQLTEQALTNADNLYGCPIDLGIPEYIWVERNGDGEGTDPYKKQYTENNEESMVMADWSNDDGLHQTVPEDRSKYMQVQVTGVVVKSVPSGLTDADGNALYHTVVELYSGELEGAGCIGRIRIEGFETTNDLSAAATMENGKKYVAASSVGFSLNGEGRASPIQIDAEGYTSTCRHIVDESVWTEMNIVRPEDGGNGDKAYDENVGAFSDVNADYSYTAGTRDAYCAEGTTTGSNETLLNDHTGIFVRKVRGDITGTSSNDMIWTDSVNDVTDYAKEHMPDGTEPIANADAFFSNRVEARTGNNVIVAGDGDNYLFGGTLVKVNNGSRGGENYITTPDLDSDEKGKNPRCFVNVEGSAKTYLYNPIEYDSAKTGDSNEPGVIPVDEYEKYITDDYYNIQGSFEAMNPYDKDLVQDPSSTAPCGDLDFFTGAATEAMEAFEDELTKLPETDTDVESALNWDEINGEKTSLDDEMNTFFEDMFGASSTIEDEETL